MVRCLSLVVLWLGRHVVSGGVQPVEGGRDALAGLRDGARRLVVCRLVLVRRRRAELAVRGAGGGQRLDEQAVGAAVGGAELLSAERLRGLVERGAERAR